MEKKNNVKISVIMPVYNASPYLRQALDSIISQTFKEIEIICVDDGSTDDSLSILYEYQRTDPRIAVIRHTEKTEGAAAARNIGIEKAKGEFLSILDADDYFEPNMLEEAFYTASNEDVDIVLYDGWVYDEKNQTDVRAGFILQHRYLPKQNVFSPEENADNLFVMAIGAAWGGLYRRSFILKNGIKFQSVHHADDLGFVFLAFACAERIAVINKKFVHYRKNTGVSQSDKISLHPESMYLSMELLKKELEQRDKYTSFRYGFAAEVILYSMFYLNEMRDWDAFEDLYNALKERYYQELGVYDLTMDHCANRYWINVRDFIKESSAGKYAYYKWRGLDPFLFDMGSTDLFPYDKVKHDDKVVLYGAGAVGRSFYKLIKDERYCACEHVVDSNHQKLNNIEINVENPDKINSWDFDYIVICVLSEKIQNEIKRLLLNMGIDKGKIITI